MTATAIRINGHRFLSMVPSSIPGQLEWCCSRCTETVHFVTDQTVDPCATPEGEMPSHAGLYLDNCIGYPKAKVLVTEEDEPDHPEALAHIAAMLAARTGKGSPP